MKFYTKGAREHLKNQICNAMMNSSACYAFISMQEINEKNHHEFKKLGKVCDKLDNYWEFTDFCIDRDLNLNIPDDDYHQIIEKWSNTSLEEYKSQFFME